MTGGRLGKTAQPQSAEETVEGTGGTAPPDEELLQRGDLVGRYVVIEPIGRGAMGVVYKAFDPELDRAVAVKLLLGEADEKAKRRAMREAKAIAKVSHPNVIAVHDVGTHNSRVFFAMELVDGRPLHRWKADTTPGLEKILDVFRQAGSGLAAAHAAGIVHRDFKPENVLVDDHGRVRVLDFGLARGRSEGEDPRAAELTPPDRTRGGLAGTPAYMAPEQFGGGSADGWSDQFSFCVALHEALSGERPFQGDTVASLSYAVLAGERAAATFTGVPGSIVEAIDRGLSHDPAERFPSMEALVSILAPPAAPKRWGRWAFAGFGALLVATGTAYGVGLHRGNVPVPEPDPCVGSGEEIADLWTDADRDAVVRAFTNTDAYNAQSMGSRVQAMLDAYAARWQRAAQRSCEMIEVERALGAELSFRSRSCIETTLASFGKKVEEMKGIDTVGVEAAVDSVDALDQPEECVDRPMLELRVEVPSDPDLRREVAELKKRITVAIRHFKAGSSALCLETLAAVEDDVRDVGHQPTLVIMLQLQADCLFGAGQDEAGRRMKRRVFELALASGHDLKAIQSAANIAHTIAVRTTDYERADTWLRTAEALVARHGLENTTAMRSIANVRGILASRQGKPDEAVRWFQQLTDLTRETDGVRDEYVIATSNIGVTLANDDRLEEALGYFQAAVEAAENFWGPDHGRTGAERSKLAQMYYLLGRIEEAREMQLAALESSRRTSPRSLDVATALHVMGMIERRMGNDQRALEYVREAYVMRERLDAIQNRDGAELTDTLSSMERIIGDPERATQLALSTLAFQESQEAGPLELMKALTLVSAAFIATGDVPSARPHVRRASTLALSSGDFEGRSALATILYRVGTESLRIGEREVALQVLARAEAAAVDIGSEWRVSETRTDYVEALADAGRLDEARSVLTRLEAVIETHPYPPSIVDDATRLRERLGR